MYSIEHTTIVSDIEQGFCAELGRLVGHILTGKHSKKEKNMNMHGTYFSKRQYKKPVFHVFF